MPRTELGKEGGLTVLMPAFNEADKLSRSVMQVVACLDARGLDYEILIVDDASTDETNRVGQALAENQPRVRLLRHAQNQGPCSGLRTGPPLAAKPWLLLLPVDLAIPLADIDTLWESRQGNDIVLGYIAQEPLREPARLLQSRAYTLLVNALFGMALRQVNYVALYRTELLRSLPLSTSGVALHAEILVRATRRGAKIRQVGVGYERRKGGTASGSKPRVIAKTVREVLGLRYELFRKPARAVAERDP